MTEQSSTETTPRSEAEERALRAAEALAAADQPVTARSVRERAGVAMAVASAAATAWNEKVTAAEAVPDIPDDVLRRFAGVWAAAHEQARSTFTEERDGLRAHLREVEAERDDLIDDLAEEESRRDQEVAAAEDRLEEARLVITDRERQLEEQRERHEEQVDAQREELIEIRTRADRAEAALTALQDALGPALAPLVAAAQGNDRDCGPAGVPEERSAR